MRPLRQTGRFLTCRLPSPDKKKPNPVAENKSWPLMSLLPMAQAHTYLPAIGCQGLGTMC
jgi:hypothetical protein